MAPEQVDTRPLCFVLMPFGRKRDDSGLEIDFDAVYAELIAPAVQAAEMVPLRADQESGGGIIHKPMFERLLLCDYAVADLTTANANVFYELGVRHAVRPWATAMVFAVGGRVPFDVAMVRAIPYRIGPSGELEEAEAARRALTGRLDEARREQDKDSPIFQLIDALPAPQIDRLKTDVFRDRARHSVQVKERLQDARALTGPAARDAVRDVEASLGPLVDVEAAIVIDLLLSYRAVDGGFEEMVRLVEAMPEPLRATALVQEQYGLALNRVGKGGRAEEVLTALIDERGPSSETLGILGRVYKDRYEEARADGRPEVALGYLTRAVDTYLRGFEADWRDAYPGINALTLLEHLDPHEPRSAELVPVVRYAVKRRLAHGGDYWDWATMLELAALARDPEGARQALASALGREPEGWQIETTYKQLAALEGLRRGRGEDTGWLAGVVATLRREADAATARGGERDATGG
jgi:MAP3K TRAFs-binding domain